MAKGDVRTFTVQRSYFYDTHDENREPLPNAPTESEWKNRIVGEWSELVGGGVECPIDWLIMGFHDADINEDGVPKGLHAHAVPHFKNQHSQTGAMKILGASSVQNCEPIRKSTVDAVRYLLHVSENALNDMKTIYPMQVMFASMLDMSGVYREVPLSEVVARIAEGWTLQEFRPVLFLKGWALDEDGNRVEMTLQDIQQHMSRSVQAKATKEDRKKVLDHYYTLVEAGELLVSDIKRFYREDPDNVGLVSRDFAKDRTMYEEAYNSWLEDMRNFYNDRDYSRTNIYISGIGGRGKDDLSRDFARLVADNHGFHLVSAKGHTTYDFAGNYMAERVSLLSDITDSCFPIEQFLNVYDPKHFNFASSRNVDKFYFPAYAVFTSSLTLESFIYGLVKPYAQKNARLPAYVRRRLNSENGITERDWIQAYISNSLEVASKFHEVRRRFAVYVYLTGKTAEIYFRSEHELLQSFLYDVPMQGCEPFILFDSVPFDRKSPDFDTVHRPQAARRLKDAVKAYYDYHGYVHTDDCEKPDFSSLLDGD